MTRISIKEAAEQLCIGEKLLRQGLKANRYPFAEVYQNGNRTTFVIYQEWLDKYKQGTAAVRTRPEGT